MESLSSRLTSHPTPMELFIFPQIILKQYRRITGRQNNPPALRIKDTKTAVPFMRLCQVRMILLPNTVVGRKDTSTSEGEAGWFDEITYISVYSCLTHPT